MKPIAFAAMFVALSSTPSLASFGLMCTGPDGINLSLPLGAGPGVTPLGAELQAVGRVWTTEAGVPGTIEMLPAQSATVGDRLYFDFADTNYEGILVEVRLFRAHEEADPVYGGTLRITGHGAWPIWCEAG